MFDDKIPNHTPTFEEISKQMRINVDILKDEISNHCEREIEIFKKQCMEIKKEILKGE